MGVEVNKNIPVKTFVIITIFAILAGLAMLYIATKGFINVNITKKSKKAIAEIYASDIVDTSADNGTGRYERQVKYTYLVNNKEYKGKGRIWWRFLSKSDKDMQTGDKIDIYHNIDDPSKSEIYHISYGLIAVAICFIILVLIILRQRIKAE